MANTTIVNKQTKLQLVKSLDQYPPIYPRYSSSYLADYGTLTVNRTPRVTQNFAKLRKLGSFIAPLPYTHSTVYSSVSWGTRNTWYMATPKVLIQVSTGLQPQPSISMKPSSMSTVAALASQAENLAVTKLLLAIKDSKANLVQAYAESGQTHRMIATAATKIAAVIVHLKAGKLDKAGRVVGLTLSKRQVSTYRRKYNAVKGNGDLDQVLASGVLTVQYGIKPLLSDVVGAAELYAQKRSFEVINKMKKSHSISADFQSFGTTLGNQGRTSRTINRSGTVTVQVGSSFTTSSETFHTAAQLGITNPLLIAWELLPWSFVIDWFIPIGNAISAMDATLGLTFRTGYISTKVNIVTSEEQVWTTEGAGKYSAYGDSGSSTAYSFERSFTRKVLTSFPSARLPAFKNPVSWEHALNAISLLTALRGGKKRLEPFKRGS